jgi:hypothetical protein
MIRPLALLTLSFLPFLGPQSASSKPAPPAPDLAYAPDGQMLYPSRYREWTYLTSGLGMSYSPGPPADHPNFDNVFVNPSSYRAFLATGTWPNKTVLVIEVRHSETRTSITQRGHSQGAFAGLEVHVRDESLPGKWGFFEFDPGQPSARIVPLAADCYTCHQAHAAVDTTFVQFYPTLFDIAKAKNTLSPAYLQETQTPAK